VHQDGPLIVVRAGAQGRAGQRVADRALFRTTAGTPGGEA